MMAVRKPDQGGSHAPYFAELAKALREGGFTRPTLVIDRARLNANIDAVRQTLDGSGLAVRIVVKSLPAHDLISAVAKGIGTQRYMVFNAPMLLEMARLRPQDDFLLGKPLPVAEAASVLRSLPPDVSPQWLIDTRARLEQYADLARQTGRPMRVNLEIDVGLHRGGFATPEAVGAAVDAAVGAGLKVSGLMGYDPHVPKMPSPDRAFAASRRAYAAAKQVVTARLGADADALDWNTAGSPTYAMHAQATEGNEVAIGSAFVKPRDFDLKTLAHHQPAAFIATPVIKALSRTEVPGMEAASGLFRMLDPNTARAFFIHGGHWLAAPESPPGLEYSPLFGRSSNQELLTGSDAVQLSPDDTIFFRPNQSEAVFLQFGDIAIYEDGRIVATWPTFPVSA
jgi:D-serine deaminase-like pyridoxal phosphate-dependent protein